MRKIRVADRFHESRDRRRKRRAVCRTQLQTRISQIFDTIGSVRLRFGQNSGFDDSKTSRSQSHRRWFKERLRQILPDEKIEVRTANNGLCPVRRHNIVSNLMTVGGVQQVMLKVRFAEMQRSISKSLSSSVALQGEFVGR